jgi:hypothetical protein
LIFDEQLRLFLQPRDDGFAEALVSLPVQALPPHFDLEGAEAVLEVTMEDARTRTLKRDVRLVLTFTPVPELPDVERTAAALATVTPTPGARFGTHALRRDTASSGPLSTGKKSGSRDGGGRPK